MFDSFGLLAYHLIMYIEEKPAFMQTVELIQEDTFYGYTLQIDYNNLSASIIISKKGGIGSMLKTVEQVKAGYEQIYDDVLAYEQSLEEKIRQQMAEDLERVKTLKAQCVETVEIEVPDEEVEQEIEAVSVEENV